MLEFDFQFIWTGINLIVLFLVLRKFLFKPVTEFMEKRSNSIRDAIEAANRNKAEMEKLKAQYEEILRNARNEADAILKEARDRAESQYEQMIEQAHKEVEELLDKAAREIENERNDMMKELRVLVSDIAFEAASKVIQRNIDSEENRRFVAEFIDKVGAA